MTNLFDGASWLYLSFVPDPESGGICAGEPIGTILTRAQCQELIDGLTKFIAFHSDEEIDQYNRELIAKRQAQHGAQMTSQPRDTEGFVYLLQAENGLFKIGKAKNLTKRFKPFHVKFPMKWEMVHSFRSSDYSRAETQLLKKFADKKEVGEWFRLSSEDIAFIKSLDDFSIDPEH